MQVTKEPLEPCQVALTIEVEGDKVVSAVDKAYREFAKYVNVPGFRKGKAPMNFVRQRVPETDVRQRTAELLVEPAYAEAIKQEDMKPYGAPKIELQPFELSDAPFVFKAVVPVAPQVELGQYTGLTVERKVYDVSDEAVDKQLERLRDRAADYPKVERAVEDGDLVIADVAAITNARPEAADFRPTMIQIGEGNIPGFDEEMIGLSVGDEKSFTLTYPDDYPEPELAGETADFSVKINEVRRKELPPLDDALAAKITNGTIATLDAFKADLRSDLEKSLRESAENEADQAIVDQILLASTIKFPPQLTEAEVNQDAQSLMARLEKDGVTLEDYLERTGRTREQLIADFTLAAEKRIRIGLVLGEIAEKESLSATEEDIDAEIAERAAAQRTTPAAMRAFLEGNNQTASLSNRVLTKKVLDFLRASTIMQDKVVSPDEQMDAESDDEDDEDDIFTSSSASEG